MTHDQLFLFAGILAMAVPVAFLAPVVLAVSLFVMRWPWALAFVAATSLGGWLGAVAGALGQAAFGIAVLGAPITGDAYLAVVVAAGVISATAAGLAVIRVGGDRVRRRRG